MKKWPVIAVASVVMALYAVFLIFWFGCGPASPEVTEPSETVPVLATTETAQTTAPPETTLPAETTVPPTTVPPVEPIDESLLTAKHVFVYDATGDRLLYTYGDQKESISPASLTKLFTCYVALQYLDPDTVVEVGEEAGWIGENSSVAAVFEGTRLTVEMIVQGAMMQSGNDAAYALAVAAGRAVAGDPELDAQSALDVFMEEMNRQAQHHGLTGSHFVTPDGYDKEGHCSTAEDLLAIAKLAMSRTEIIRYASVPKAVVTFESGENYTWKNTNWMLHEDMEEYYCPEAVGLKTGATDKAGKCVIAVFDTGEKELIIGVLGCEELEQRFQDALALFEHYR